MPFLKLQVGHTISFLVPNKGSQSSETYEVLIDRVDDRDSSVRSYTGLYKGKKIYFVEFKQAEAERSRDPEKFQQDTKKYTLTRFRATNPAEIKQYQGSHLVINSFIPPHSTISLPDHLVCYFLQANINSAQSINAAGKPIPFVLASPISEVREAPPSAPLKKIVINPLPTQRQGPNNASVAAAAALPPVRRPVPALQPAQPRALHIPAPANIDPALYGNLFNSGGTQKLLADRAKDAAMRQERLQQHKRKAMADEEQKKVLSEHAAKRQHLLSGSSAAAAGPSISLSSARLLTEANSAAAAANSTHTKGRHARSRANAPAADTYIRPPRLVSGSPSWRRMEATQNLRNWLGAACPALPHQIDVINKLCVLREQNIDNHHRAKAILSLPQGTDQEQTIAMMTANGRSRSVIVVQGNRQSRALAEKLRRLIPAGFSVFELNRTRVNKALITSQERQEERVKIYERVLLQHDFIIQTYHSIENNYKNFPWDLADSVIFTDGNRLASISHRNIFSYLEAQHREILAYVEEPSRSLTSMMKDATLIQGLSIRDAVDKKIFAPIQTGLLVLQPIDSAGLSDGASASSAAAASSSSAVQKKYRAAKLNLLAYNNAVIQFLLNSISPATNQLLREMPTLIACSHQNPIHPHIFSSKLQETISVEQLDPQKKLRNKYAQNIAAKFGCTLEAAQERADADFVVSETFYQQKNVGFNSHHQSILDRFEMGGIQFLITTAKGLSDYCPANLKQVVAFHAVRSDNGYLSKMGARPMVSDPADGEKVAHFIQVVTSDTIGDYKFFAEKSLSEENNLRFQYGDLPPKKPDEPFAKIPASGEVTSSEIIWQATPEFIATLKNKRAHQQAASDPASNSADSDIEDNDSIGVLPPFTPALHAPFFSASSAAAAGAPPSQEDDEDVIMSPKAN